MTAAPRRGNSAMLLAVGSLVIVLTATGSSLWVSHKPESKVSDKHPEVLQTHDQTPSGESSSQSAGGIQQAEGHGKQDGGPGTLTKPGTSTKPIQNTNGAGSTVPPTVPAPKPGVKPTPESVPPRSGSDSSLAGPVTPPPKPAVVQSAVFRCSEASASSCKVPWGVEQQ